MGDDWVSIASRDIPLASGAIPLANGAAFADSAQRAFGTIELKNQWAGILITERHARSSLRI